MANTASVYARIDPQLKKDVDEILEQLQITPSALIQMLYGQIKLTNSIPFDLRVPLKKPVFADELTLDQLNLEIGKGLKDVEEGRVHSADEVNDILRKEFGI